MAAGLFSMTSSRQHEFELHSPALCEELRIRDILDNVAVMTSGAFVAAYELSGVHSYYHTEEMRNRAKESLEAVLRSMPELKTSSKRYADSQGENQLDGLIYAYAMHKLGFRTTGVETLIRYDVLVKTKSPAFQQIYFNKTPQDYGRLARWIQEVLQAMDRESFFPNFGWACQNCQFRSRCWKM